MHLEHGLLFMFMFTGFLMSKYVQKQVFKPWSYFVEGYIVGLWKAVSRVTKFVIFQGRGTT